VACRATSVFKELFSPFVRVSRYFGFYIQPLQGPQMPHHNLQLRISQPFERRHAGARTAMSKNGQNLVI
jgi:hypothetical protein